MAYQIYVDNISFEDLFRGSGTVSNSFQQNLGFIVSIQTIFVECRQDQRLSHDYTHTQSQRPALVVKSP